MSDLKNAFPDLYDEEHFRDQIATVDEKGKRIWIYPKKPKGTFYNYRQIVAYTLIAILFILPWLKYNGEPLFLFNIVKGKFIIFGMFFGPQDFYLFVIAMLIVILAVVLFTVIFGRVFCGWVCPQTVFMEMVYRRIEYWIEGDSRAQKKLNAAPWDTTKIWKKTLKHFIFFALAVTIANTFLAYIIGTDQLINIITDPISQHFSGFIAMIVFSMAFYGVFAFMREQVCTTVCPYGRLQGVLLDNNSLAVQYDYVRGEPRGRMKRKEVNLEKGDCIDCKLCVQVCPTGIDIRDGIQLECVNCTACMDACDEVMVKIKKPKGLIRIDSITGVEKGVRKLINKRTIAYTVVLLGLVVLQSFMLFNRSDIETLVLRTPGTLYYEKEPGKISNLYNYQLINKTKDEFEVELKITNIDAKIDYIGQNPTTISQKTSEGAMFVTIPKETLKDRKTKLIFEVYKDGKLIDKTTTNFLGPLK